MQTVMAIWLNYPITGLESDLAIQVNTWYMSEICTCGCKKQKYTII